MKKQIILLTITLLILIALMAIPVQAQTITMSNPGSYGERDIAVYNINGSLQGMYNTTSTITLDGNQSYTFSLVPKSSTPLDDPGEWLGTSFAFISSNAIAIILMIFLAALWLGRR